MCWRYRIFAAGCSDHIRRPPSGLQRVWCGPQDCDIREAGWTASFSAVRRYTHSGNSRLPSSIENASCKIPVIEPRPDLHLFSISLGSAASIGSPIYDFYSPAPNPMCLRDSKYRELRQKKVSVSVFLHTAWPTQFDQGAWPFVLWEFGGQFCLQITLMWNLRSLQQSWVSTLLDSQLQACKQFTFGAEQRQHVLNKHRLKHSCLYLSNRVVDFHCVQVRSSLDGRHIPKHLLGNTPYPPLLKITFSQHTDLNVRVQSHRSRWPFLTSPPNLVLLKLTDRSKCAAVNQIVKPLGLLLLALYHL